MKISLLEEKSNVFYSIMLLKWKVRRNIHEVLQVAGRSATHGGKPLKIILRKARVIKKFVMMVKHHNELLMSPLIPPFRRAERSFSATINEFGESTQGKSFFGDSPSPSLFSSICVYAHGLSHENCKAFSKLVNIVCKTFIAHV